MGRAGRAVPRLLAWTGACAVALAWWVPASAQIGVPACQGGEGGTTTTTTSTTSHTTTTRVDFDPATVFQTRVVAVVDGVTLFDQTAAGGPNSAAAQALRLQADATLSAAGAVPGPPQETGTESVTVETHLGNELVQTETSITTSTTFGPATILVGEDQSITCFIPAGTTNVNVNTHTERFVHEQYQEIETVTVTLTIEGTRAGGAPGAGPAPGTPGTPDPVPTPPAVVDPGSTAAAPEAAVAVEVQPRFAG